MFYQRKVILGSIGILSLSWLSGDVSAKVMDEACYGKELVEVSKRLETLQHRVKVEITSAGAGDVTAQVTVGSAFLDGQGVPANPAEANRWLTLAAKNGSLLARFRMLVWEDEVTFAERNALTLLELEDIAARGFVFAQVMLAQMYEDGYDGKPRDYGKAAEWWTMAAEHGCRTARYVLAAMHRDGQGVPQSNIVAYQWFWLAGSEDDTVAQALNRLAITMSPAQLAQAKAGVNSWLRKHR